MIVLLMGPAGSGKTTIGTMLAAQLKWEFVDGDSLHPASNVEKIRRGIPLTDEDRRPWLDAIHDVMESRSADGRDLIVGCSALKQTYRERLLGVPGVNLVYLKGSFELLKRRLHERTGHFAGEQILASQFADLEEPDDAVAVDISAPPEAIVTEIRKRLGLT